VSGLRADDGISRDSMVLDTARGTLNRNNLNTAINMKFAVLWNTISCSVKKR
jgi:hypothetical protein